MDKYNEAVKRSEVTVDPATIKADIEEILQKHLDENRRPEVYRRIYNSIDLTTLRSTDSNQSVAEFTEKVNAHEEAHPDLPSVASICVYPSMVQLVRTVLDVSSVRIT